MNHPKPVPTCRKCQEPLPLDADGKKIDNGLICLPCKIVAVLKANKSKKPIAKQTPAASKRARIYATEAAAFLELHRRCAACKPIYATGVRISDWLFAIRATEIHHTHGRLGELLNYKPWWLPVCRTCHNWIGDNPLAARLIQARGFNLRLLCAEGEWNTKPSGNP
jgi:hypothetical protein